MRIFVAGATGVIGVRLVPLLLDAGHTVAGLTRARPAAVEALGAEPIVADAYDATGLREAVAAFAPDLVINELTDLPDDEAALDSAPGAPRVHVDEAARRTFEALDAPPGTVIEVVESD
ncbi:MAG TPA: NAD-dependent epimerase/dehydratase family protein [Nocardioidaceae bacterium]|nr:NAD-dependent epimerase/dehydratase family protein [Nocardioidaceae bacterium]